MNTTNNILIARYLINVWYVPLIIATIMSGVFEWNSSTTLRLDTDFLLNLLESFLSAIFTSSLTVLSLYITLTFFVKIQRPKWVDKFLIIAQGWLFFLFSIIILLGVIPENYIEDVISGITLNFSLLLLFPFFVIVTAVPKEHLGKEMNDIDHLVE